jgi:hypothetical protein
MTQRLCAMLAEGGEGEAKARVQLAVAEAFLDSSRPRDPNLRFAETYIERQGVPSADLVPLYRRVLEGDEIIFDPNKDVDQHLCLSGLVVAERRFALKRRLRVRNRVVAEVLGLAWVWEREREQVFGEQLRRWVQAGKEDKGRHLLKGRELREALEKVKLRGTPGAEEEAFLRASQAAATRTVRLAALVLGR